jgi:predicted transposase YbfD/YdcC
LDSEFIEQGVEAMAKEVSVGLDEVVGYFAQLEDPRSSVNRQHPLESVVVIAILAILAGASGPTAIAKWALLKEEFLARSLNLPFGVPCKDVFRRVLAGLRPEAFQAGFVGWLSSLKAAAQSASDVNQPLMAIDGKTARRSHDRRRGLGAMHAVSVWASEWGLSLGQVACDEKSNEITAIPELLKLVDISGAIITIDAMGTQKAIAAQIVENKADYVLALKGNQESLHDAVIVYIDQQIQTDFANVTARTHTTSDKGHGREETRTYVQLPAPQNLPGRHLWKGLRTIGVVISLCLRNGKETVETRYYISSLALGVKQFARAIRSHWSIENTCHWSLDVTYREDESRTRDQHARENFAWLNRFTLSLLKQHPGKDSLAMKRRMCGWNDDYLLQVLTKSTT